MKRITLLYLLLLLLTTSLSAASTIIPRPSNSQQLKGLFRFDPARPLTVSVHSDFSPLYTTLANDLARFSGITTTRIPQGKKADIRILKTANKAPEGYALKVLPSGIIIEASEASGAYYALQSLMQLMPLRHELEQSGKGIIECISITDHPSMPYRGMHLDVARHMYTVDSLKRYIDLLAMHKLNRFHWHLTDDQGWRIQIKSYPLLTEIGAYRQHTAVRPNSSEHDNQPYGGYYTQAQIKEIVAYAAERFITIIPEVDMPGHTLAALAAYPQMGCRGSGYEVTGQFGVFDDVLCPGNDKVYEMVFSIIDELTELFPSQYIHIGGDECPKTRWKECPKCQNTIQQLGLHNHPTHSPEELLQSHFNHQIEAYLNAKGRRMIGWDEILEGGISPSTTVMAWRSPDYAYQAASRGSNAILTPTQFCYFDYYPTLNTTPEPTAPGGYLPTELVYSFCPIPPHLPDSIARHIIGIQGNLWTEYIRTFRHVEYMTLPRMAALSEVAWSSAPKDEAAFLQRLDRLMQRYLERGYHFGSHIYHIKPTLNYDSIARRSLLQLHRLGAAPIYYTTDGSTPTPQSHVISQPLPIDHSMTLKAMSPLPDGSTTTYEKTFTLNATSAATLTLLSAPHPFYTFRGAPTLNDGIKGDANYRSGDWLGFNGTDAQMVLDVFVAQRFNCLTIGTCIKTADWVFPPTGIRLEVSDDGVSFHTIAHKSITMPSQHQSSIATESLHFPTTESRFWRITAECNKSLPHFHVGNGQPGFLFIDEITLHNLPHQP